jgi:peroxiredoxin
MKRLCVGDQAPDFSLPNHEGRAFRLAEVLSSQNVMLVFNLGFI